MHSRELILQGLTDSAWLWFSVIVCLLAGWMITMLLRYERRLVSSRVGNALLALRLAVLAVIFLTLLQPVVTWTIDKEKSGRILVAVDVSESMDTADSYATKAELLRWARALEMIGNPAIDERLDQWITAWENDKEPQWVDDSEAASDQQRSELEKLRRDNVEQIVAAVRDLPRREVAHRLLTKTASPLLKSLEEIGTVELRAFAAQSQIVESSAADTALTAPSPSLVPQQTSLDVAMSPGSSDDSSAIIGVVVLTDGRHNSGRDPVESATRLGTLNTPVVPIMIGSERRPRDISILSLEHPQIVFRGDTPVLNARIAADGFRNEELTIVLTDEDGMEQTQAVRVPEATVGAPFVDVEFALDASEIGRREYSLRTDIRPEETRDDNNQRRFAIQIVDDKSHVVLIDQAARWEFRFLDNALARDERVELTHVLFDQPYLGVLPTTFFPRELRFPTQPEDVARSVLSEIDLLVIGDVSPREIGNETWSVIEHWVRESGGTIVLLAGKNSMPRDHTSDHFKRLLPMSRMQEIDLRGASGQLPPDERGFRLNLTPDAERTSMFQLDADPVKNRSIWSALPGHVWGLVGQSRPGSTVFATARHDEEGTLDRERENAVIVHQYYGFGQTLWIGIDSTWRWRHRVGDRYHHRFWGQLARWAAQNKASAGNEFVRLTLDRNQLESGDHTLIQARWQQRFLDLNPDVKAAIEVFSDSEPDQTRPVARIELTPVDGQPLVHEGRTVDLAPGTWKLRLVAEGANLGSEVAASLYINDPQTGELSDLSANHELLTRIAEASGGRVLLPDESGQVVDILTPPDESLSSREETTLWDHWLIMCLFFVLLTTEWVVRKLNGLP